VGDFRSKRLLAFSSLFGRKLSDEQLDFYLDSLEEFGDEVIALACTKLEEEDHKFLPRPIAFKKKCAELKKWIDSKNKPLRVLKCMYRSENESVLSSELCKVPTEEDAAQSELQGWPIVCEWHYCCIYAKAFPNSNTALMVQRVLADRKYMQSWSGAQLELYCRNLGFDPLRHVRDQENGQIS
jgi:hypothetical protein